MRILALVLALALSAGPALAQQGRKDDRRQQPQKGQMKQEDRERMRNDMKDAYRERPGQPDRPRQMSPEERDKLRRDIEDANRALRK
jgi:Ni/Co efflux regulator RcnB